MGNEYINSMYRQNLENDIICYLAEICGREIREMAHRMNLGIYRAF